MIPIERQQRILTLLEQEESIKVSKLSKKLGVSEMTVYRDIKPLIEQQLVMKTSNGIMQTPKAPVPSNMCSYCSKSINSRLSFHLIKANQETENTCCAHCGLLRYQDIENEVSQVICRDFLTDTTINATSGLFLLHTDIPLNCCQPQVIPFYSAKFAEQFQMGFGGELYNFEEAIHALHKEMDCNTNCSTKHTE